MRTCSRAFWTSAIAAPQVSDTEKGLSQEEGWALVFQPGACLGGMVFLSKNHHDQLVLGEQKRCKSMAHVCTCVLVCVALA